MLVQEAVEFFNRALEEEAQRSEVPLELLFQYAQLKEAMGDIVSSVHLLRRMEAVVNNLEEARAVAEVKQCAEFIRLST